MKIKEAENRLWKRIWVCVKCKSKQKADGAKIRACLGDIVIKVKLIVIY